PSKVPVKMTVFGTPFVPFPLMINVPPAIKVPPICRLPDVHMPVLKLTLPKSLPVTRPDPFSPLTAIRTEPLRLIPALLPVKVPPLLVKSTPPLLANAAIGRARAIRANHNMRFIEVFLFDHVG